MVALAALILSDSSIKEDDMNSNKSQIRRFANKFQIMR